MGDGSVHDGRVGVEVDAGDVTVEGGQPGSQFGEGAFGEPPHVGFSPGDTVVVHPERDGPSVESVDPGEEAGELGLQCLVTVHAGDDVDVEPVQIVERRLQFGQVGVERAAVESEGEVTDVGDGGVELGGQFVESGSGRSVVQPDASGDVDVVGGPGFGGVAGTSALGGGVGGVGGDRQVDRAGHFGPDLFGAAFDVGECPVSVALVDLEAQLELALESFDDLLQLGFGLTRVGVEGVEVEVGVGPRFGEERHRSSSPRRCRVHGGQSRCPAP